MKYTSTRNISEIMRDEMSIRSTILNIIREDAKTIPEIAKSLNSPSAEVMYWVMAMWRYGYLEEEGKPDHDGYYKYRATKLG